MKNPKLVLVLKSDRNCENASLSPVSAIDSQSSYTLPQTYMGKIFHVGRDRGAGGRAEEVNVRTRGQRRRAGRGAQSGGEQGT